jgi:hypothetical protein
MADQMTDLDSAREWLYFAQMDLNSAEYLVPMRQRPYERRPGRPEGSTR